MIELKSKQNRKKQTQEMEVEHASYAQNRRNTQTNQINWFLLLDDDRAAIDFLLDRDLLTIPLCNRCPRQCILQKFNSLIDKHCFRCPFYLCRSRQGIKHWSQIRISEMVFLYFHCFCSNLNIRRDRTPHRTKPYNDLQS